MYKPTIGLEIHIELKTKTKMFCDCSNDPDEKKPNVNICPICMGHPGTMPVINRGAVNEVIKTGLALNCQISPLSKFDRKNYFYPDLPKGYQISQYDKPFCTNGHLKIGDKKIGITRIHLEEDTGRLIHPKDSNYSLVDFNRAGIPLMELVTEPDMHSAQEARTFAEELQLVLRYLNVSGVDMEKGQMRIEVNISLSENLNKLGTKVEIKNLNSFRAVEKSIEYEIDRQSKALKSGKKLIQETRGWDSVKGITKSQREKESAHDYRYFPEPDLPPIQLDSKDINIIKNGLTELPQQKRERFAKEYELPEKEIEIFVVNKDLGEYFEKIISELEPRLEHKKLVEMIKLSSNYLISDLTGLLKGLSVEDKKFQITAENFAELITLINKGSISSKIAKIILAEMFKTGADPSNIIKEKSLSQITNKKEIEAIIQEVITHNGKAVEDFKNGKENSLQFLIGQVMARAKGRANPDSVKSLLKKTLAE
ncbi:MAG: Asp-tRNA(Asn)/Glu-tRNA(Gln) amidotransferase subunit GatB [Patescibacteria group bacterium]|nr:Asp-tRNA(Asn)/Glu-tRNA(Gln) amidotransferase subunit GatB [Patescibacteria group bacterium]MBU1876880.1 Asp-tRNA(Asn)/Glu-tRNA(Gln) amidotransferase subunit GatB [Patescibacteria group bacterium]